MTRNNDTFISLRNRVRFARKHSGDLFISLHADATKNKKTRGTSIYSLSEKASDKLAKDLAVENVKTLEKLLPLYDVPELSLSRYMLSGFIYSKFNFSKSKACKFHSYSTIYNKNEFGLKKTNNLYY